MRYIGYRLLSSATQTVVRVPVPVRKQLIAGMRQFCWKQTLKILISVVK